MGAEQFDVAIVGTGMVGATLAWGLLQRCPEIRLALIDSTEPESESHPSFDNRALALSANTVEQLAAWKLWSVMAEDAAPIKHIQVTDRGHFGATHLHATDHGVEFFGQVLEVQPFAAQLIKRLREQPKVSWLTPLQVTGITQQQSHNKLQLSNGQTIEASLLVVADGGRSPTREQLGIGVELHHYGQTALIANLSCQQPHNGWAYERFTRQGPLALLPMSEGRTSLVWCMDPESAKAMETCSEQAFIAALQQMIGYRLGRVLDVGLRECYPLTLMRTERLIHHRSAIIGNAAHSLHPIAGQGFNLGMRDIQALVVLVAEAWQQQNDIGCYPLLSRYRELREGDIALTSSLTDGLCRLFSNDSRFLALLRSSGLTLLQHMPWLQSPVAKLGMGRITGV